MASDPSSVASRGPALHIVELDETVSTNADALRLAERGERGPLWVMAHRQTGGRGRSGRTWESLEGNLMATHLRVMRCPPQSAGQISLLAGVAAWDCVAARLSPEARSLLRLKWPNDLLMGGRKLAGILVGTTPAAGGGLTVVIGFGMNLARHPTSAGIEATNLSAHGVTATPTDILQGLDAALAHWAGVWADGSGFSAVREAWLERASPRGERVSVNTGTGRVDGSFAGIDADGALLIMDQEGRTVRFTYGDVTLAG